MLISLCLSFYPYLCFPLYLYIYLSFVSFSIRISLSFFILISLCLSFYPYLCFPLYLYIYLSFVSFSIRISLPLSLSLSFSLSILISVSLLLINLCQKVGYFLRNTVEFSGENTLQYLYYFLSSCSAPSPPPPLLKIDALDGPPPCRPEQGVYLRIIYL